MIARDARLEDVPALVRVKTPAVLHKDRVRDASEGDFRYLVAEIDEGEIIGHACLLFRRPRTWPDEEYEAAYPLVIDLMVREDLRRKGFGAIFLTLIEAICVEAGHPRIYLNVDPVEEADAFRFYRKNGYHRLEEKPQWRKWSFTDSQGNLHEEAGWDLRLYKDLRI